MPPSESAYSLRAAPPQAVADLIREGLMPLAARVLAARGVSRRADALPPLKALPAAELLPGIAPMSQALAQVCRRREPICIVGDYDVDGVTAAALMYQCLRRLGADAHWHIPARADGYGLSAAIAERQAAAGMRHLLTVDNGTCAHDGIAAAQKAGMRVYVTDHHQPDGQTCAADILVNPHVNNGGMPAFNNLVGVGLAFYLAARLRADMAADIDMKDYLDLVALGSIADCGGMDSVNRALTGAGLARIRAGKTSPGIRALLECSRVKAESVNCKAVSFRLAPRLNAAGRLESAEAAMTCLLAATDDEAMRAAQRLDELNSRRMALQEEVLADAERQAAAAESAGSGAIVVAGGGWHAGVVGIVAGRLASRCRRPAFAFHLDREGRWRGSGRSAAGVNLIAVLKHIAEERPDVIYSCGGHRQAAGASVHQPALEEFRALFSEQCAAAQAGQPAPLTEVDAVSPEDITPAAIEQLQHLVWGVDFPAPRYAGRFTVASSDPLGASGGQRLTLRAPDSAAALDAIYFGGGELPAGGEINIIYSAEISAYNGLMQLVIETVCAAP